MTNCYRRWQRIIRRGASPLRGRPNGRSSTLRVAVERGQGEPHVAERQYMEVLAVRSEAGCGALRNRTARPTKKAICNILIYMDNVTQKQNV
jgi:hypothetical protein